MWKWQWIWKNNVEMWSFSSIENLSKQSTTRVKTSKLLVFEMKVIILSLFTEIAIFGEENLSKLI